MFVKRIDVRYVVRASCLMMRSSVPLYFVTVYDTTDEQSELFGRFCTYRVSLRK